ncbi:hypothetical protein ACWC6I_41160 [Streptomyces sp. NPDC001414]
MNFLPPGQPAARAAEPGLTAVFGEGRGITFARVGSVTVNQGGAVASPRSVRSAYVQQVRRIAPPVLHDRDAELAELAAFCLEEDRGPYVWWQAGPWAGKSALMSSFVLSPSVWNATGHLWLVSFFITARLAAQDTRGAFTTVLTEQLCALLGTELPPAGNEATRDAIFLDLLEQAAVACQQAGGRLVLVLDGLDEDRGVTTGPDAHSIAGLLPGDPPAGMRIIVAGRPNPPIPDDVPDWHALRDPGIVRLLGQSPHAKNLERLGQMELRRLLTGSLIEQDLLGLLTAARGGLSGKDLRDLTRAPLATVEAVLHTVAGRAFERRMPSLGRVVGRTVYLLGHEELYNAARHYLDDRMAEYRSRLHRWADGYRVSADGRPPWPTDTPSYLLSGYSRMLAAEGETDRLVALTIDQARHDRMLSMSGGDTAALSEIAACQDMLLRCPEPDLSSMARLSHHRGRIESRNDAISATLPQVWAALGQPRRAEALAYAINDPGQRTHALAALAHTLADAGDDERSGRLLRRAETDALSLTALAEQAQALAYVAEVMAGCGDYERAAEVAGHIGNLSMRAQTLADLAAAIDAAGERQRAERLMDGAEETARDITDPDERMLALSALAKALARSGEHRRARALLDEAAPAVASLPDAYDRVLALVSLAQAAAYGHDGERGAGLTDQAEQAARTITDPTDRARALVCLIAASSGAGQHEAVSDVADENEAAIEAITDPGGRAWPRAYLAEALAGVGNLARAARIIQSISNRSVKAWALTSLSQATAAAGRRAEAVEIARAIAERRYQAWVLAELAEVACNVGEHREARELADEAEQVARTIANPGDWVEALSAMVKALSDTGHRLLAAQLVDKAEQVSATIGDPGEQAMALCALTEAAASLDIDYADELADRAEQAARSVPEAGNRTFLLTHLARVLTVAHMHQRADAVLLNFTERDEWSLALAELAEAATIAGAPERVAELVGQAEEAVRSVADAVDRVWALKLLVKAQASLGNHERATSLADAVERAVEDIDVPAQRAQRLIVVVEAVAHAGDHERAEALARAITVPFERTLALTRLTEIIALAGGHDRAEAIARTVSPSDRQAQALAHVARAVGRAGDSVRAESIARTIPHPTRRAEALAEAAMAAGLPRAGRLLSEVFAQSSWLIALPAVSVHYPHVLREMADAALAGLLEPIAGATVSPEA